jgi:drug/metabolite transporter (DMT)-like permease
MDAHARRDDVIGVAMYLLAAFLFAFNGVIAKAALNTGFDPVHLTQLRNAGAMVLLMAYVALRFPDRFRVTRRELPFLIAYGVIAFTLVQYLYFLAISRLNVGIGTLLAFLAPVLVALWLRFGRKEDVSNRIWIAIALTVGGLVLVAQVWQGFTLDPVGVVAGLLCAVALAVYWLLGESGQEHRDAVSLTMWGFVFASIAWAVIAPWWTFPWSALVVTAEPLIDGSTGLPVWSLMIWGVVMGTIAPFLLVLGSLRRIGAQRAGIVGTTEPLWAGLIGFLLLGETFAGAQLVGGLIVLAGVIVAETSRRSGVAVTPGEFPQIRD